MPYLKTRVFSAFPVLNTTILFPKNWHLNRFSLFHVVPISKTCEHIFLFLRSISWTYRLIRYMDSNGFATGRIRKKTIFLNCCRRKGTRRLVGGFCDQHDKRSVLTFLFFRYIGNFAPCSTATLRLCFSRIY